MNKLYLTYYEDSTGGEICEGQEDYSFPSYEDEFIEWILTGCYINKPHRPELWLQEEVEVSFQPKLKMKVYVVYVRYGTGSTFGHTNGCWKIMGVFNNPEAAQSLKNSIENDSYAGYKFWEGYFKSFESCEIKEIVCQ